MDTVMDGITGRLDISVTVTESVMEHLSHRKQLTQKQLLLPLATPEVFLFSEFQLDLE